MSQTLKREAKTSEIELVLVNNKYGFAFAHVIADYPQSGCHFRMRVDFGGESYVFFGWLRINNLKLHHFGDRNTNDFDGAFISHKELGDFFWAANSCG